MARVALFAVLCVGLVASVDVKLSGTAEYLTVSMTNSHPEPVTLLVFNTPFDTHSDVFHANMFDITHSSGVAPVYSGIIIKRLVSLADFVTLRPGQTIETVLNLHKGYNFPLAGEYSVALSTESWMFQGELDASVSVEHMESFSLARSTSDALVIKIDRASPPLVWPEFNNTGLLGGPNPGSNCDTTQSNAVKNSGANAITASQRGANYLPASCSTSLAYYIEWFGACDATRYSKVKGNFGKITPGLQATYPASCGGSSCTANTYAYVFPNDASHTVYLCAVFWKVTQNNCVIDSQPGTLIHEMSHFSNVAATQDYTYGTTNCRNLARNNPGQAVNNADNYCYYTDSCPR